MRHEPEFVSYAKGCMSCLVLLAIVVAIGSAVVQSVGLGTVVLFILFGIAFAGLMWRLTVASGKAADAALEKREQTKDT
ncbi:hypothetical protein ACIRF8_21140 [Streptomyces sp. NPDC102406]|uniref:hypothetical protein n=1 Tax=Streptomyces sp. NPDC102406 TaxID=3366171 RepID=UPI00381E696F